MLNNFFDFIRKKIGESIIDRIKYKDIVYMFISLKNINNKVISTEKEINKDTIEIFICLNLKFPLLFFVFIFNFI